MVSFPRNKLKVFTKSEREISVRLIYLYVVLQDWHTRWSLVMGIVIAALKRGNRFSEVNMRGKDLGRKLYSEA